MRSDGHTPAHDVERFPLIAFVHVPKTGGTTVNHVLGSCSHRGVEHYGEGIPRPNFLMLRVVMIGSAPQPFPERYLLLL